MLNRKESKMLSVQRKSAGLLARIVSVVMLSVGFAATGALSASADRGPAPQSAANKQFPPGTATRLLAGTFGILDTPLQARCLSPVRVSPMTVVICRAPGVRTIWPTK